MLKLRRLQQGACRLSLARTLGGCAAAQNSAQPQPAFAAAADDEGARSQHAHVQLAHAPAQQQQQEQQAQAQAQQQQQAQQPPKMERKPLAPPGYSRTFYKRQLPCPPAIEFASDRGARPCWLMGRLTAAMPFADAMTVAEQVAVRAMHDRCRCPTAPQCSVQASRCLPRRWRQAP